MKKLLLFLLLLSVHITVFADEKDVKMETIQSTQTRPRSINTAPIVTIDDETFQLSIKFAAPNESFTVCVYDEKGFVIYQDNVITDGTNHQYLLPNLDFGNYSISIENDKRAFKGEFNI